MPESAEVYSRPSPLRPPWSAAQDGGAVLELVVIWGEQSVLHVVQAPAPHAFCVGEAARADGKPDTDFVIGREALGCEKLPITVCELGGAAVVIPDGANFELYADGRSVSLDALADAGRFAPYPELDGAMLCTLSVGETARLQHGEFTFVTTLAPAVPRVGVGLAGGALQVDRKALPWTLSSVGVHLAVLLLFHLVPPQSSALSIADYSRETRLTDFIRLQDEQPEPEPVWTDKAGDDGGKGAQPMQGDTGKAGDKKAPKTKDRLAIKGPADNRDPAVARAELVEQASTAGIIGVIRTAGPTEMSSPYGRDNALGADPENALGALLGDRIGANWGLAGGGMLGTGRGGGGIAIGTLGIRGLHTIGASGGDAGPGTGYGRPGSMHDRQPRVIPPIRPLPPEVHGALSKETIRRIVHRHLSEVRYCYEEGLRGRPDLQGRVAVKFVVSPAGVVTAAARASSNLGDARVEQCIVDAVKRWTFPAPDGGGMVIVTYPFALQHTGS